MSYWLRAHKYDPDQPRVPAGSPEGGQWAAGNDVKPGLTRQDFYAYMERDDKSNEAVEAGLKLLWGGTRVTEHFLPGMNWDTETSAKVDAILARDGVQWRPATLLQEAVLQTSRYLTADDLSKVDMKDIRDVLLAAGYSEERLNPETYAREWVSKRVLGQWATSSDGVHTHSWALQAAVTSVYNAQQTTREALVRLPIDDYANYPDLPQMARIPMEEGRKLYERDRAMYDTVVKAIYDDTQTRLKQLGVERVQLYRGDGSSKEVPDGSIAKVLTNPISSWATSPGSAGQFGQGSTHRYLLSADVPASRIFSTWESGFGCAPENEVVLVGMGNMQVLVQDHAKAFARD